MPPHSWRVPLSPRNSVALPPRLEQNVWHLFCPTTMGSCVKLRTESWEDIVQRRMIFAARLLAVLAALMICFGPSVKADTPVEEPIFAPGDVLLSMANGTVQWYRNDWTLVKQIESVTNGQAKGMAFDAS